jgi:protein disulfide-isomerase
MKKMAVGLLALFTFWQAGAAEAKWITDAALAQQKAKQENKLVLMDFTGSDWCGWCIKLSKEVFNTPEFADYAAKNLVLVEVDFPRKKKQTAEQKKANEALQAKYRVEGYPTIIVFNPAGKKIGELGYQPGGPKPFIDAIEKLKAG